MSARYQEARDILSEMTNAALIEFLSNPFIRGMLRTLANNEMTTRLTPGTHFDTPFENGCEVITSPDPNEYFNFTAYDSEHVECGFDIRMVIRIN